MRYPIPARTQQNQKRASDPRVSAWVSAHAGSGKTHVLTQRVVRLLLDGVPPSRLICLTFTKAAAANMSARVFRTLADWTLADDETLRRKIAATGAEAPRDLNVARRLFAAAVETPGGLKIQTIHAFCERVLHLFPFEANVPAEFRAAEDLERAELLALAQRQVFAAAADDDALGAALAHVAAECSEGGFERILGAALMKREALEDVDGLIARLPAVRQAVARMLAELAPKYGVRPEFALAIGLTESALNPDALSPKNAMGVMQLIPATAERFNVGKPYDPEQNIRGGLAYLRWLLAYFEGDIALAAAAYNAGEGAVDRYRGVPPYRETRAYVERILRHVGQDRHPYDSRVVAPSPMLRELRLAFDQEHES